MGAWAPAAPTSRYWTKQCLQAAPKLTHDCGGSCGGARAGGGRDQEEMQTWVASVHGGWRMAGILEPTEHVPAALAHPPTPPHTAQLIPRPPRPPAFDTPHPHSGPHTVQPLHRLPPRAHPRAGACVRMGGAVSSGGQAGGAAWQGTAGCAVGAQVCVRGASELGVQLGCGS